MFGLSKTDFKKGVELGKLIDARMPRLVGLFYMIAKPKQQKKIETQIKFVCAMHGPNTK